MVGEVTLASRARLAGLAAGVESSFEVFPRVVECRGCFVLFAGRASVWSSSRRTFVAQPAALSVLAELAELERFAAHAASLVLILLYLVASLADVGVCGEVSQRALLCAPGAPRGRGARWHMWHTWAHIAQTRKEPRPMQAVWRSATSCRSTS